MSQPDLPAADPIPNPSGKGYVLKGPIPARKNKLPRFDFRPAFGNNAWNHTFKLRLSCLTIDDYISMNGDVSQYSSVRRDDRGMVLVLVLLLLGLITALAIQAQTAARMALRSEEYKTARSQLRAAATDAAWDALTLLAGDNDLQVDHTNEPWARPMDRFLPNGLETSARIVDENMNFDVNSLSARLPDTAKRMPVDIVNDLLALTQQPDPAVRARVLRDWIDQDHEGLREADYYRSLDPPLAIADALMESPQELSAVLALTGPGAKAPPALVVLPDRAARVMPVNLNTAGREVIMAILGPQSRGMADMLCRLRDAGPLTSPALLNQLLKTGADNPWEKYFAVHSSFFSVTARAMKDNRAEEVYALAFRDAQGNVEILRWLCR